MLGHAFDKIQLTVLLRLILSVTVFCADRHVLALVNTSHNDVQGCKRASSGSYELLI